MTCLCLGVNWGLCEMREIGGLLNDQGISSKAWGETKFVFYNLPQVGFAKRLEIKTAENSLRESRGIAKRRSLISEALC